MEYIFDSKDVCNSSIRSTHDNLLQFTVSTEEYHDEKTTTTIWYGEKASVAAVIYWDERLFEIHGRKLSFTIVKAHPPGLFVSSTSRIWRWDGEAYLVKDKHSDKWAVKTVLEEVLSATLVSFRSHLFHDDELPSVRVESHAQRETIFFIMIFVYSEFKRLQEEKENKQAAKGFKNAAKIIEAQDS